MPQKKQLRVILDSGAYTAYHQNVKIDVEEYAEFLKKHSDLFLGGCINLDVILDAEASYRNWEILRSKGVDTIPVYHMSTDEKWLEKYMQQTDYICIGAIAELSVMQRTSGLSYLFKKYLLDSKGVPKIRTHGLGVTAASMITRFPWYSVDSASAVKTSAFGNVLTPRIRNIERKKDGTLTYTYDIGKLDPLFVSDRYPERLRTGNASFFSLPPMVKEAYRDFFLQRGYYICEDAAIEPPPVKRVHAKRRKEMEESGVPLWKLPSLLEEETVVEAEDSKEEYYANSLSRSWESRLEYSLDIFKEFTEKYATPIVYQVATTTQHMDLMFERGLPILLSYYALKEKKGSLFERLLTLTKEHTNRKGEQQA